MNDTSVGISIGLTIKGLSEATKLNSAFATLKQNISSAKDAITSLNSAKLTELSNQIKTLKENAISELTSSVSSLANSALVGIPIKFAIDDEAAFANVKKYVDDSDENLQKLKIEMKKLSTSLGDSFTNIADIATGGGKINLKGTELIKYTKLLSTGAVAFEMSAESLSTAANNMKVGFKIDKVDDLNEFFDAVNLLDNKVTNANASDIFEASARSAANASLIGLDAKSASAISATMLSTGKNVAVVGTSLNALYATLAMADKKGAKFEEALSKIGISSDYIKNALQTDATGAIVTFLEAISKAPKADQAGLLYDLVGGNFSDDVAGLITNINALKANIALAHSSDAVGSMNKELQVKLNTTKSAIARLAQAWRNLASSLGDTFLPLINTISSVLGGVAKILSAFNDKFPKLSAGLVSVIAGFMIFKPLLLISKIAVLSLSGSFISLIKILSFLSAAFKMHNFALMIASLRLKGAIILSAVYSKVLKALAFVCSGVSKAFKFLAVGIRVVSVALLSNPIGLILTGIALVAGLIIANWDKVKSYFISLGEFLYNIFSPVTQWWNETFGEFFSAIGEKFAWIGDKISSLINGAKSIFGFGDDKEINKEEFDKKVAPLRTMSYNESFKSPQLQTTANTPITINLNGDFNIATNNGKFD